ncbi:MAG: hypothetical protein LBT80_02865 [Lactobacillaceae bacterium]|jgi:hypothetical protein|nr:hypothetical protein [Lactobacillaceae bacterium]
MTEFIVLVLVLVAFGLFVIFLAHLEGYSSFKVSLYLYMCILGLICPRIQPPDSFSFLLKKPPELRDSSEETKKDHDGNFGE